MVKTTVWIMIMLAGWQGNPGPVIAPQNLQASMTYFGSEKECEDLVESIKRLLLQANYSTPPTHFCKKAIITKDTSGKVDNIEWLKEE